MANDYLTRLLEEDEDEKKKKPSQEASVQQTSPNTSLERLLTEEPPAQEETTVEAPQVEPVEDENPSLLDRAKGAVRSITDKIGLTDPEPQTPEAIQQNQELEQLKQDDVYQYTELVTVPALQSRIQEIDIRLATGEPDKQGIFPDIVPKIPEEKLANSIIGWATGNKNQGDQLRAERDYLQSLINGDVVSLEYQKKNLSDEEYKKVLAEQRISAVQEVKAQSKTSQVTLGATQTAASLTDLGQLVGDQIGAESLSEGSREHSDRLREWGETIRKEDEDFSDQLLQGFGSTIPFILTGQVVGAGARGIAAVSPRVAAWFAAGTSGFLEAGSEAGAVYVETQKDGKSQEEAVKRANALFIANLGWNSVLNRFGLNSDEALGLKKVFYSSSMESVQEMGQQMASNLATDRPFDEGLIESGIIGAVVGSGVSTLTGSPNAPTDPIVTSGTVPLGTQVAEEEKEVSFDVANPDIANIVEEAAQYQSAEDFASIQGTTVDSQIGVMSASDINPRDTVDTTTEEYKNLVADIRANGIKEPVVVTVSENGEATTFEGSHRVTAAREAGRSVPVIVTEGSVAGLPTISEFYDSVKARPTAQEATAPTEASVRNMNRQFNQENTNKLIDETMAGNREDLRLNSPEAIYRAGTALGSDVTPETEVIVYRAGLGSIAPGDYVTTNRENAERYLSQREGAKLESEIVKVSDLVAGGGLKTEFIYAPPDSIGTERTSPEQATTQQPGRQPSPERQTIEQTISTLRNQVTALRDSGNTELADQLEATIAPMQARVDRLTTEEAATVVSTPEGRKEASQTPVKETTGRQRKSKYFTRIQDRLSEEYREDVTYTQLKSIEDTERAIEFVEKFPKRAERVARGLELPPEGIRQNAISVAVAEKARADGNAELQADVERTLTLRLTRQGQEIQAVAGRMNETNPHFYIKQVLQSRMEKMDRFSVEYKQYKKSRKKSKKSEAQIMNDFVDMKAKTLKKESKQRLSKVAMAQEVIDNLTC